MVRHRHTVRLATLLIADGEESLRTMPLRDLTRLRLAEDAAAGDLDDRFAAVTDRMDRGPEPG
ncbi:MAG: hypothetical protein ACLGIZ_06970 [Acidimicrobiia bacterium]|jgi:hypothetical protein